MVSVERFEEREACWDLLICHRYLLGPTFQKITKFLLPRNTMVCDGASVSDFQRAQCPYVINCSCTGTEGNIEERIWDFHRGDGKCRKSI